jgi:cell division transport system permease protein
MMSWLSSYKSQWRHQPILQIATMSVLTGTFTVIAAGLWIHQNFSTMLMGWGQDIKFKVYLSEQADDSQIAELQKQLRAAGIFHEPNIVSKETALERFRLRVNQYLPGFVDDSGFINPLPRSIETQVDATNMNEGYLDIILELATRLGTAKGVDQVSYGQGWIENYSSVLKVFNAVSIAFMFVLLGGALFVIGNSIHSSILSRKDEIEILELFGATKRFIIKPFVMEGAFVGFVCAFIALAFCFFLFYWQKQLLATSLPLWNVRLRLEFLSWDRILMFVLTGGAIGASAAYFWTNKLSTGWAASQGQK